MNLKLLFNKTRLLEIRREKLKEAVTNAERYNVNPKIGLDTPTVEDRIEKGLVNKKKKVVTKSYLRIFTDNFFSFFNILIFSLGILVAAAGKYQQLMFLGVILINCAIGIYQDIHARKLVNKLSIINKMKSRVIRDGKESEILSTELVLDDIILLKNGDQIPADCILITDKCSVNEAMLTGEPDAVKKKPGDILLSGTYISSGECRARVDKISILNAAEEIQAKASTFRKPKSEILRSLNTLFRIIGVIVILLGFLSLLSYMYVENWGMSWDIFTGNAVGVLGHSNDYVTSFVGTMVAMIPAGLFLLTSIALSTGLIKLVKKRCLVQELYSIEMLARVDTLCLDKTGTITDGTMVFTDFNRIDKSYNIDEIGQILKSIVIATKDNSYTTQAILNKFSQYKAMVANAAIPFSSENKYSAAEFDKLGTFVMGAFGYINIDNKVATAKIVKKYSSMGYRCLLLCQTKKKLLGDKLPSGISCIGVILLEDHIRDAAPKTLAWFAGNNVNVRVISGDDPLTVCEIAKKVGIKDADKYISLEGKTIEEVKQIANDYTIFGRVSPDQKEALVIALKESGRTVAMTGDGVNDILALKRADCSIAMASGSDAAKNVSHLVLLDSDFNVLPSVVSEGRRVINNLQRTSSLFLCKTIFTMLLSLMFIIVTFISKSGTNIFPLSTNNFYVWEIAVIGVGGFFLSLEPNSSQIKGHFLSNAIRKALPVSSVLFLVILAYFILYQIDVARGNNALIYNGIHSLRAMASISMALIGFVSLFRICLPFTKYRAVIFVTLCVLTLIALVVCFNIKGNFIVDGHCKDHATFGIFWFAFCFEDLAVINYVWMAAFLELGVGGYIYLDKLLDKIDLDGKLDKIKGFVNKNEKKWRNKKSFFKED